MIFRGLAYGVLAVHLTFALWVYWGGFIARRSRPLFWLHMGSCAWALVAMSGASACPLTVLENQFRAMGGLPTYPEECIPHYFWNPLQLPQGWWVPYLLTSAAVFSNFLAYRPRRRSSPMEPAKNHGLSRS